MAERQKGRAPCDVGGTAHTLQFGCQRVLPNRFRIAAKSVAFHHTYEQCIETTTRVSLIELKIVVTDISDIQIRNNYDLTLAKKL